MDSDILGANRYISPHETTWTSILVRSGVYTDTRAKRMISPKHRSKMIVDTVEDAVRWGLRQSNWRSGNVSFASDSFNDLELKTQIQQIQKMLEEKENERERERERRMEYISKQLDQHGCFHRF